MDIRELLQYEIARENERISELSAFASVKNDSRLVLNKCRGSGGQLYLIDKKGNKKYVNHDMRDEVMAIKQKRFARTSIRIMKSNVAVLEQVIKKFVPCDAVSVNELLPPAYRLTRGDAVKPIPGIHQSENPFMPDNLKYSTSFGLLVRSKNELLIAEQLKSSDLKFYYEKALAIRDNGTKRTIFPDFTIPLSDGRTVYWEHMGGFDNPKYADDNLRKIKIYYDNGVYMPENLIITMDSEEKPINVNSIARIIECRLKPFR